jgi:hypothetical protein
MALLQDTPARVTSAPPDALIPEAREIHRRRRRRRWGAALIGIVILAGGGYVLFGGGGTPAIPPTTSASPSAIGSFLAEAKRGTAGTFAETYRVTVRYARGARRHMVDLAQRSPLVFAYKETPSLLLSRFDGPPVSHSYEVFVVAGATRRNMAGIYSCSQALPPSRWSCIGPYTGIGMGTTGQLLGPYPPQALLLGLDNAVETYTGQPAGPATDPQPAFLVRERLADRAVKCLSFGHRPHIVGRVCLDATGVIAYYDIRASASYGTYRTANLIAYSPRVRARALALPATPQLTSTLRSGH